MVKKAMKTQADEHKSQLEKQSESKDYKAQLEQLKKSVTPTKTRDRNNDLICPAGNTSHGAIP